MVLILRGLPGGEAESHGLRRSVVRGRAGATSDATIKGTARLWFCSFESAITCGETACLQQECDIGMAELSHMLAIFMQQACSAAVIVWPGIRQAASGWPSRTSIRAPATIWKTLFNISILP